jgi:hypothetical protein
MYMTLNGKIQNGAIVLDAATHLPEGTPVTVWLQPQDAKSAAHPGEKMTAEEHRRILAIGNRIASLPDENPGDTFSGADHDKALYGEP